MGHGGREYLYLVVPPIEDELKTWSNQDLDREALDGAAPVEGEGDGVGTDAPSRVPASPPASVSLPTFLEKVCDHRGELHQFTETCACGHVVNTYSSLEGSV